MREARRVEALGRREFVRMAGAGALLAGLGTTLVAPRGVGAAAPQAGPGIGGDEALRRLMDGNRRFAGGRAARPHQTPKRRTDLVKGQTPMAIVLGCSDSRVPPEIVFDQGLGDLFVVRVAGNIVDDLGLGSIEYGAGVLGAPLLVVLGHAKCGAVEAALKAKKTPGHIGSLVRAIQPAADAVKGQPGDPLANAIRANVVAVVGQLRGSKPVLADLVEKGRLRIVGARYDLDTGVVELIA